MRQILPRGVPRPVFVLAVLYFIGSLIPIADAILGALYLEVDVNIGVLGAFVAWGLLTGRYVWRTLAIAIAWVSAIANGIGMISAALVTAGTHVETVIVISRFSFNVPEWTPRALMLSTLAIALWKLGLLYRSDVRVFFLKTKSIAEDFVSEESTLRT